MDPALKKKLSIVLAIACLALTIVIVIKTNKSNSSSEIGDIRMLCVNAKCNHTFELSEKEFKSLMSNEAPMSMQASSIKCPKCEQKTAAIAMKCEKCSNIYVPNYRSPESFDKCPKCGFSRSHQ